MLPRSRRLAHCACLPASTCLLFLASYTHSQISVSSWQTLHPSLAGQLECLPLGPARSRPGSRGPRSGLAWLPEDAQRQLTAEPGSADLQGHVAWPRRSPPQQ